jgi:ABC-type uncharacterized transport system substrate-binding protein
MVGFGGLRETFVRRFLLVQPDPAFTTNRVLINTLALGARLPTMHGTREHVDAGGLISYGTSLTDMFRRAGDLVDKVLRGMKPARGARPSWRDQLVQGRPR